MTTNFDVWKKQRIINTTLAVGDNAATNLYFTLDPNAPAGTFPSRNFVPTSIEVLSSAGAQKTGWSVSYNRSGVSAGILTLNKGSLTFATADTVTITGIYQS